MITKLFNKVYSFSSYEVQPNRNFSKYLLFDLITFGFYSIYWHWRLGHDLNNLQTLYDSKNTSDYIMVCILSIFTFGIPIFIWHYHLAYRVHFALLYRELPQDLDKKDFWYYFAFPSIVTGISYVFVILGTFFTYAGEAETFSTYMWIAQVGTLLVPILSFLYVNKLCKAFNSLAVWEINYKREVELRKALYEQTHYLGDV